MYTQCTSCATLFRVSARHLREAGGRVRCCLCRETFNAVHSLIDNLPSDLPVAAPEARREPVRVGHGQSTKPMDAAPAPSVPPVSVADAAEGAAAAPAETDVGRDLFLDIQFDSVPELEAEPAPPAKRTSGLAAAGWAAAILLLIGVLMFQYAYFTRDELAQEARLRPWLEAMCRVAGCDLPLQRDIAQVQILQRRVEAHPSTPGALLIRATLSNEANFRQPYPELRLSFLDANGREQVSRWFAPADYLENPELRDGRAAGMPPKQPIAVRLEVVDPGRSAENFEISFR